MSKFTYGRAKFVIATLDKLALALTNHDHQWTDEERQFYEAAVASLTEAIEGMREFDSRQPGFVYG